MTRKAQNEAKKVQQPNTPKQDVAYHVGTFKFLNKRGYPNLAQSHLIYAVDISASYPEAF